VLFIGPIESATAEELQIYGAGEVVAAGAAPELIAAKLNTLYTSHHRRRCPEIQAGAPDIARFICA
jgi:hypothetical protein